MPADIPGTQIQNDTDWGFFMPSLLDDYELDPYELRIYLRVARRAGSGKCFESIPNMAKACKMTMQKVRDVLAFLGAAKMLIRSDRPGRTSIISLTNHSLWAKKAELPMIRESVYRRKKKTPTESDTPIKNDTPIEFSSSKFVTPMENDRGTPIEFMTTPLSNSIDEGITSKGGRERDLSCDSECASKESPSLPVLPNKTPGYMHPTEKMEARLKGGGLGRFWPQLIGEGLDEVWIGPGRNDFDANLITAAIAHLKKYELPHERGDALQYIRNCITKAKFADLEARMDEAKSQVRVDLSGRLLPTDERERGKNWHEKQCWAPEWQEFAAKARAIGVEVEPQTSPSAAFFFYTLPGSKTKRRTNFAPTERWMYFTIEGWRKQIQGAA